MEDCVACFEFGNTSEEACDDSSAAHGDVGTLVDGQLRINDDEVHRANSVQSSFLDAQAGDGSPSPHSAPTTTDDTRVSSRGGLSTTWAEARGRLAAERHRVARWAVVALVLFLTAAMGATEVQSPKLLGVFALSLTSVLVCSNWLESGALAALAVVCVALGLVAAVVAAVRRLEQLEAFSMRFEQAGEALKRGRSGDALGPPSLKPAAVPRQAFSKHLGVLVARAKTLYDEFEQTVIQPLAAFGDIKSGVKGRARAHEKAWIDYDGDYSRLTDLLRGCCICRDMDGVLGCWNALRELVRSGEIEVVEIKNRYRDGATVTGYMDLNVRFVFRGFTVEVQVLVQSLYDLKHEQTPVYEVCRSLDVVGASPSDARSRRASLVQRAAR